MSGVTLRVTVVPAEALDTLGVIGEMRVKGEGGVELAVWYIPAKDKKGVVIASHNLGGNKSSAFTGEEWR